MSLYPWLVTPSFTQCQKSMQLKFLFLDLLWPFNIINFMMLSKITLFEFSSHFCNFVWSENVWNHFYIYCLLWHAHNITMKWNSRSFSLYVTLFYRNHASYLWSLTGLDKKLCSFAKDQLVSISTHHTISYYTTNTSALQLISLIHKDEEM